MKTFWKIVIGSFIGCVVASIVMTLLGISLIGSMASFTEKQTATISGNTVLRLCFATPVGEQSKEQLNFDQFSGASLSSNQSVYSIVRAIDDAAADPLISFIYIKPDMPALTLSQAEEIRAALQRFRQEGKAVVSFTTHMYDESYYLASVADKILFNPDGDVFLTGMSTPVFFFKDALDKLGIEVQLIRHGKYKAAGESFVMNGMSPENRRQNEEMIKSLWSSRVEEIASSRQFSAEQYNGWIDNLELYDAASLLEKGLVDQLCYRDELEEYICSIAGQEKISDVKFIDVEEYARISKHNLRLRNKIAIVYCNGELVVEEGMPGTLSANEIAAHLSDIRRDSTIKAVVLRVNSPGGSAIGAGIIDREIGLLKEVKPVIASFGDYAASGGFWIAAGCDKIFTDKSTLTGSVGVFSIVPAFGKGLKNKLGINVVSVNSNKHSDVLSMMDTFDREETEYMVKNVEKVYSDFTSLVAEGRSMSVEQVDSLGQGRVWTGTEAVEIGFADAIGGLRDAVLYAQALCGGGDDNFRLVEYPRVKTTMERIMESVSSSTSASCDMYSYFKKMERPQIYARIPYIFDFSR